MKIKEVLLGIIIGVVLLMFLVFGAKLIYEKIEYEQYCNDSFISEKNDTQIKENLFQKCNEDYYSALQDYSKKMFLLSLIVGVLIIAGSAVFVDVGTISGGTMFGSLMFIIYGTGSYWKYMDDWVRFIILGVALGILIYVGYWVNNRENKKSRKRK